MRKHRYPKPKQVGILCAALTHFLMLDEPLKAIRSESEKGTPNVRIMGTTNEHRWMVDVYAGDFFCIFAGGRMPETCKTVQGVIAYLKKYLYET
jgi:hypothetical protein